MTMTTTRKVARWYFGCRGCGIGWHVPPERWGKGTAWCPTCDLWKPIGEFRHFRWATIPAKHVRPNDRIKSKTDPDDLPSP